MIYLPLKKTKIRLVLLCTLITFNVIFEASKSYVDSSGGSEWKDAYSYEIQSEKNTSEKYLLNLPKETLYIIYLGYLYTVSRIILSVKISENET